MMPLDDLRILDLTRVLSGPTCTQIFSDFGATVWKVESREGDETRSYHRDGAVMCNRGKKSLVIDLAEPRGQKIVRELVAKADVAVENFRPGGLKRFGLDFDDLSAEFPQLIAASLSGFGQNGPLRDALGYDAVVQAATGQMSINGYPDMPPARIGIYVNDLMLGLNAAGSILVALHERARSGLGQRIDVSLFDAGLYSLLASADTYMNGGPAPQRLGPKHPFKVPVQPFDAKDGPIMICVGNDGQFQRLCHVLGLEQTAKDPRLQTNEGRRDNRVELEEVLQAEFSKKTMAEWMALFVPGKVPAAPVNDVPAVVADAQTAARNLIWEVETDTGTARATANPFQHMSRTPPTAQRAPRLGEHTREVLSNVLDMTPEDIGTLARDGVVVMDEDLKPAEKV